MAFNEANIGAERSEDTLSSQEALRVEMALDQLPGEINLKDILENTITRGYYLRENILDGIDDTKGVLEDLKYRATLDSSENTEGLVDKEGIWMHPARSGVKDRVEETVNDVVDVMDTYSTIIDQNMQQLLKLGSEMYKNYDTVITNKSKLVSTRRAITRHTDNILAAMEQAQDEIKKILVAQESRKQKMFETVYSKDNERVEQALHETQIQIEEIFTKILNKALGTGSTTLEDLKGFTQVMGPLPGPTLEVFIQDAGKLATAPLASLERIITTA